MLNTTESLPLNDKTEQPLPRTTGLKPAISIESFVFLAVFFLLFGGLGAKMGGVNMVNTLMNTALDLLMNTVFYILAIAVLAGAFSGLLSEFGVVSLINKILSPLMKPIYDLPGAASLGILTCYLSDNPAILTLAEDQNFTRYFKKYQLPALTNIGTAFGMGLIIATFMVSMKSPIGESFGLSTFVGTVGAIIGSIVSTRLMLRATAKVYGKTEPCICASEVDVSDLDSALRSVRKGSIGARAMDAMLSGGKVGVDMGLAIIPGVLIICSIVLLLTNGPSDSGLYTGAAGEGVALLPLIGEKLSFILTPLFGFSSPEAIGVPITSLGAAGAAIGLVPSLISTQKVFANDVAVFTAMCMCWSGYLSTHVAMMDTLKCNHLTGKAIASHTIGGLCAGVCANWLYQLVLFFL